MSEVVIQTTRLTLRPFAPMFAAPFFQVIDTYRDDLNTYFPKTCATNISLLATEAFMVNQQQAAKRREAYWYAIFLQTADPTTLIGTVSIRSLDWRVPKGELAYFIIPPYRHQGYAKEALTAFVNWCFDDLQLSRVYLETGIDNQGSQALALSCGFLQEGRLRSHYRNGDGKLVDTVVFGALQADLSPPKLAT